MDEFAQRLGMSADALTVLGYAAEQTGSSQETLNMALQRMQNLLGEAAAGSDTAAKAFASLGLGVSDLKALTPDQAFAAIAEQMQQVGSSTERTKITLDIFGKSSGELINLLAGGAEGLNEFGAEAESMGLLLGDAAFIRKARAHPLARAIRADKLTLAGLAAIGLGLSFTRADPALMVGAIRIDTLGAGLVLAFIRVNGQDGMFWVR